MTVINVLDTDDINGHREKFNTFSENVGDIASLVTASDTVVGGLNEVKNDLDTKITRRQAIILAIALG